MNLYLSRREKGASSGAVCGEGGCQNLLEEQLAKKEQKKLEMLKKDMADVGGPYISSKNEAPTGAS